MFPKHTQDLEAKRGLKKRNHKWKYKIVEKKTKKKPNKYLVSVEVFSTTMLTGYNK